MSSHLLLQNTPPHIEGGPEGESPQGAEREGWVFVEYQNNRPDEQNAKKINEQIS